MFIGKKKFLIINFIIITLFIFFSYFIINNYLTHDILCPKNMSFFETFWLKIRNLR